MGQGGDDFGSSGRQGGGMTGAGGMGDDTYGSTGGRTGGGLGGNDDYSSGNTGSGGGYGGSGNDDYGSGQQGGQQGGKGSTMGKMMEKVGGMMVRSPTNP